MYCDLGCNGTVEKISWLGNSLRDYLDTPATEKELKDASKRLKWHKWFFDLEKAHELWEERFGK